MAICISESMPSCIRAPPETVKPTTGRPRWVACSNSVVIFSPTAVPMEPIMKPGSITNSPQGQPPMVAKPVETPSAAPERSRALLSFSS